MRIHLKTQTKPCLVRWSTACLLAVLLLFVRQARAAEQIRAYPDAAALLNSIKSYQFGQSRKQLVSFSNLVHMSASMPGMRKKLCAEISELLQSDASVDCKKFLCAQLSLIGTSREAGLLIKFLSSKDLSLAARAALERIPGPEALAALRDALKTQKGKILIGIINTLGVRKDMQSVAAISKYILSRDAEIAAPAIEALGNIGGKEAVKILFASSDHLRAKLLKVQADSLLKCAEGFVASGNISAATAIYREMLDENNIPQVKVAILLGLLANDKKNSAEYIKKVIAGKGVLQQVALQWIGTADSKAVATVLKDSLTRLQPGKQVAIIQAIAGRKDKGKDLHEIIKPVITGLMSKKVGAAIRRKLYALILKAHNIPNLAAGGTATSPDGLEKDGVSGGDAAAIDGDPGTFWDEEDNKPLYRFCVELKKPSTVSALRITGYQQNNYAPRDFDIICDGKTVKSIKGASYEGNEFVTVFDETRCSKIELKITGYYGKSPAIRELGIYHFTGIPQNKK